MSTSARSTSQPVSVLYGGAHLFRADTVTKLGAMAQHSFATYAEDPQVLVHAFDLDPEFARLVHERVSAKLLDEPVEDLRIDFEDGYGFRTDEEEDADAERAAGALADAIDAGALPRRIGFRVKAFGGDAEPRARRTLDRFLRTLLERTGGSLPDGFALTLPKVTAPAQVAACAEMLTLLERSGGAAPGSIALELLIETPEAIYAPDGRIAAPALVDAGGGRVRGAHLGAYDYLSLLGIIGSSQRLHHPACDTARSIMQIGLAPRGIELADGATNFLPIAPHRGADADAEQLAENRRVVHDAWRASYADVRHSLEHGFYQGWDLHPAQLPARYVAVFAFFLRELDSASARMRRFLDAAASATRSGSVFDDAATVQGLLNSFLRAIDCGAITPEEAAERTGLSLDELRGRSFQRIVDARR